jgi:hypothetical protein
VSARRALAVGAAGLLGAAALPAVAAAHGLVGRTDIPIPAWLFGWAASTVLVASFVALAILWTEPRLEREVAQPLFGIPGWVEPLCGAVGVAIFALAVYAGFAGSPVPTRNLLPTVAYVVFWVTLVPACVLLGDVFRPFNPWRATGRLCGWLWNRAAGVQQPGPLPYPAWLGRWPAVLAVVGFGWLELVAPSRDVPSVIATAACMYGAVMLVGMSVFGVEPWTRRADGLAVLFDLYGRLSPITVQDGHVVHRRFLSGLQGTERLPGTVAVLACAIGVTTFDGAGEGPAWGSIAGWIGDRGGELGLSGPDATTLASTVGLVLTCLLILAIYAAGIWGARRTVSGHGARELWRDFAPALLPIAVAYVVAHYCSFMVFQLQGLAALVSNPLGSATTDLFGTADATIDYSVLSATTVWYLQVAALVLGHVAALAIAHDRGLVLFGDRRVASKSQYAMLTATVAFTSLGLWLLSAANG